MPALAQENRHARSSLAGDWTFPEARGDYATHRLHPWPGRFIPQIPAKAIAALSEPGDLVLDTFCGCGTTALEARLAGRRYYASDANPLATAITRAKCSPPGADVRRSIEEWQRQLKPQKSSDRLLALVPPIPNRGYWFSDAVAAQLAYLLEAIEEFPEARTYLRVVLSSVVTAVSYQESETRYRRIEHGVTAHDVLARFRAQLNKALRAASSLDGVTDLDGRVETQDARLPSESDPSGAALAVFSPPYPNSFDYHLYHRFRMMWLGFDPVAAKHVEIGAHLRYEPDEAAWCSDMRAALARLARMLGAGGFAVAVVGDGVIRGRLIASASLLAEVAEASGLAQVESYRREIPAARKSFKASDGRLREETVLILQKL